MRNQRVRSYAKAEARREVWLKYGDAAGIAAQVLQANANLWPRGWQREAFGPLQDGYRGGRKHVLEAKGLEIVETLDAVEVSMINLGGFAIDVDEGERGASDFVFAGGTEAGDQSFGEGGFAAAEVAGEQNEGGGTEAFGEFPSPVCGFLGGMGDEFFSHAGGAP